MSFVSEIEAMPLTGVVQRLIAIDEKHGVIDVVFLAQFREERTCDDFDSSRLKLCME